MADKLISFYELVKEFNTHCGGDCEFCDHHLRVHGKSKTRCLILNSLRAADAVEVVRCRECKYAEKTVWSSGEMYCRVWKMNPRPDGFCHMGARMDAKDMDVPTKDGGATDGV